MTEKTTLQKIWGLEQAIKENLLLTVEAEALHKELLDFLKNTLPPNSLPGLRFRKKQTGRPMTWWSNENDYPIQSPWNFFQPYLEILEQYEAEKTLKKRFETEGLFIETRSKGDDLTILVGERNGTPDKAHIFVDSKTGEIRIEENRQEPTELVAKVEAILTLKDGRKIKTTREAIEEMN